MNKSNILSICASGHGVGGAVCVDGSIVAATTLERLTRTKYDILLPISRTDLETFGWKGDPEHYRENVGLPFDLDNDYSEVDFSKVPDFALFIDYLLESAGLQFEDIGTVVYSYRHIKSVEKYFKDRSPEIEFIVPEHHFSHSCQAFLPSGFDEAAIMVVDGQGVPMERTNGDQLSGCLAYGKGNHIETLHELPVRYSLGGFYGELTSRSGFNTNEEGKTMGLAPYGSSDVYDKMKADLTFNSKEYHVRNIAGHLKQGLAPNEYLYSLGKYTKHLKGLDVPVRKKGEDFSKNAKDIAFAAQKITEDVMIFLANWLYEKTGSKNLCIAGGVGLNCVANYKVLEETPFENIFIHPNPGDNGLAVGQALYVHNVLRGNERTYVATHDSLGKEYSEDEIEVAINKFRDRKDIRITKHEELPELYDLMAERIENGEIVSWWQGRSEYGPRALGNRSILADPRGTDMKDILNSRVKFREAFRPFTPSVLAEKASDYFTLDIDSPFMLLAPYVKPGKGEIIPAITHADNTARVQTVTEDVNERYYGLIKAFEKRTGVPVLLDTSFNVAGEPIVETPEDAILCFLSTDIDTVCVDKFVISKIK